MKKWIRRLFWIVPVLLVGVAILVSLRPKPVPVETTTLELQRMRVTVSGEGKTRVKDRYVVMAPVHGNLARIELRPGDPVDDGTVLATIEPIAPPLLDPRQRSELAARAQAAEAAARQASAAVSRAQAASRFAKRDLERIRTLAQQGTLSRADLEAAELTAETATKDLESAEFGLRVSKHERDMAKAALERTDRSPLPNAKDKPKAAPTAPAEIEQLSLHSPISGRVLKLVRDSEGVINPGEPLLELADLNALEIVLDVLTTEAVQITSGDRATLLRWGGEGPLHGRVRLVEPAAFTKVSALGVEEQRVNVVIDIEEPPEDRPRLGDGFALDVEVTVWESPSTLTVPLSALFRDAEGWNLFVVSEGTAALRRVEIGKRNDFDVEILSGVEAGETVILHPGDRVHDGTLVTTSGDGQG
jgi:HlyD family secretion protein